MPSSKTKVAVLGGGVGSLVAAYELSKTPQLRQQYEVTVYQMGWRLGGKGASGRNTAPEGFQRIEEHGLHIWLGNYQNAFLMMRDCYDHCRNQGLTPSSPFQTWEDAFKPNNIISMMEKIDGKWEKWQLEMPMTGGWPGEADQCLSVPQLVARVIELLQGVRQETPQAVQRSGARPLENLSRARDLARQIEAEARAGQRPSAQLQPLRMHLEQFRSGFQSGNLLRITQSDVQRRKWILVDLATTMALGIISDVLLPGHDSLDVLDDLDFRTWLQNHGASADSLNSAPVRNTYEIVFGYRDGNDNQPSFAAGTAARFLLRWVGTYRGGFIYEMQAGMGDIVFAPLYLTLQNRGVTFRFFQRVLSLHLNAAKTNVERIHMGDQVRLVAPQYNPLIDVKGVPSWPSAPRYEQLDPAHGPALEALKQTHPGLEPLESAYSPWANQSEYDLNLGTHFDKVVLGIPLGALPIHCAELIAANSKFAAMTSQVRTVATQSFQLWLNKDAVQLGFVSPQAAILDSYLDSFADFSHLIPREDHPSGTVQSVAYFCKQLQDPANIPPPGPNPAYESNQDAVVKTWSRDTLLNGPEGMRPIWPNAYQPGGGNFRWDWLTDQRNMPGTGPARFDAQFWCANVNPSDRYVQALAGTTKHRLKADESGFQNVVLAGDWIKTGIDAGCIEGATLGGMQAARAISGFPQEISGENDFCSHARSGCGGCGCLGMLGSWLQPLCGFIQQLCGGPSPASPLPLTGATASYVERGGEQVFPQPFDFKDVTVRWYVVDADYNALQALCNHHLNNPSMGGVDYWPAIGRAVVVRMDIGKAVPQTPGEYDYGFIKEGDVALFIPVVSFDGFTPTGLGMFAPYLFVDHVWGVLCGREIYGLHKIPSQVSPVPVSSTTVFHVDAHAVQTAGTGLEVKQQRVLAILAGAAAPGPAPPFVASAAAGGAEPGPRLAGGEEGEVIRDRRQAWTMLVRSVFGPEMKINVPQKRSYQDVDSLLQFGNLPLIALKQFRDVANGRNACYQAITESPARWTGFTSATMLSGPYRLRVEDLFSHPLKGDFGWTANERPVTSSWKLELSFELGEGKVVWRA
jgi:uncharacterized protein with NAD-binding domain and iron-sulfur cluster